ncbi:unnamed protein product [Amoebophrya sp. A25]|nr:unnamed protein product [Amoebophrya sp. A25]|eukprot:GSA25T00019350001.1
MALAATTNRGLLLAARPGRASPLAARSFASSATPSSSSNSIPKSIASRRGTTRTVASSLPHGGTLSCSSSSPSSTFFVPGDMKMRKSSPGFTAGMRSFYFTSSRSCGTTLSRGTSTSSTVGTPLDPKKPTRPPPSRNFSSRSFSSSSPPSGPTSTGRRDVAGADSAMSMADFHELGDAALEKCIDLLEKEFPDLEDFDIADGVLKISLPKGQPDIVVNKHQATKQIWYSSPCGAQYFDAPYATLAAALRKDLESLT